jgi:hypothetical protein
MQRGMMPHPVPVAAALPDVAVMHEAVDQRRRHHLIAEDLAPFLEALVRGQHRRGVLVATRHELEEEHRPGPIDRQVVDLVDDEERAKAERLHAVEQPARLARLLERGYEIAKLS